jgi:hypothetical protein
LAALEILGPCPWWSEGVRLATYDADGQPRPVAAVLGPELSDAAALQRARTRAAPWVRAAQPGVLPLVAVEPVTTTSTRWGVPSPQRAAWLYEDVGAVSAPHLFGGDVWSHRVAAELVAAVSDVLEPLAASGRLHPGTGGDDVLVSASGMVYVSGFVSPFARAPAHRPPRGEEDSTAVVWRLGVLLAELLTGAPPTVATDRSSHDLALRRLLIRVMSRPGPVFTERYRDWLVGMLAWDADQRPPLSRVGPALRELAASCPGLDLSVVAARRVPELRRIAAVPSSASAEPSVEIVTSTQPPVAGPEPTEEATYASTDLDDVTAVSLDGEPPPSRGPVSEHGILPVHVGPPPEAVVKPVRLPEGLFRGGVDRPVDLARRYVLVAWFAVLVLAFAAAVLALYVAL